MPLIDKAAEIEANKKAYRERQKNFGYLKEGLISKYVADKLDLKDRQLESILKITDTKNGDYSFSSGYFHACTAFGKTYLMLAMAEGYREEEKNKKIIIFEENTGVLEQVRQDFIEKTSFDEKDIGTYYWDEKVIDTPVIVCTYASMEDMINQIGKENIGLVLCDEAHHSLSDKRKEFIQNTFAGACMYGFTGTPEYNATKTCEDLFKTKIDKVDIIEGVNSQLLCSVKNGLMVSRIPVDLTDCKNNKGDYDNEQLMAAIEKASHQRGIRESIVDFYLNASDEDLGRIHGKTTLINVPNQKEADKLAEVFNEKAGQTIAKAYHTNSGDEPLAEFNESQFAVLIQVNRLSEGYSNPKVELCINYPTASIVRETQCSGRALRYDKDNPHKMALVLDIVFKKEDGSDVYEQIAKNGQVIFKDVAQDVCVLAPDFHRPTLLQKGSAKTAKEKSLITDDMLFDVITNYEDLFKFALEHEENLEDVLPARKKVETDINKEQFVYKCRLEQNGRSVSHSDKTALWNELQSNKEQNILIKVQAGPHKSFVLPKENILLLRQWLAQRGIIYNDVRAKLETDISKSQYTAAWSLIQDGKTIKPSGKTTLWNELENDERQNILIKIKSGCCTSYVLPQENISLFKQWLKQKGIFVNDVREKLETDMINDEFQKQWLLRFNGKSMRPREKSALWIELENDKEQNILTKVKSGSRISYVLPQENISLFKQWLTQKGVNIVDKESTEREKLETDIIKRQFVYNWRLNKNGEDINRFDKFVLWDELQDIEEQNILIKVKSGSRISYVLPQKNISLFKQWLKQKGFDAISPIDKLHENQKRAAQAETKEERRKYLAQAKKLFESLNPEVKKQNICPQCLEKIKGGRK